MNKLFLSTVLLFLFILTFTSCADELETYPVENQATTEPLLIDKIGSAIGEYSILLPDNIDPSNSDEYIASLTEQELVDKINTVKIFDFLVATDNLQALIDEKPDFEVLTIEDVYKYAPRDAEQFYTFENVGTRGCNEISRQCIGTTLRVTERCCWWSGGPICYNRVRNYWNHITCTNPCSQINCPPNQYCSNGACHNYPSCTPPCPNGMICGGNNNCFWP